MEGKIPGVRYGQVVNNEDPTGAGRIAVRLIPDDNAKRDNEEIEVSAFPIIPKMFHILPKVGEGVFVFLATLNDGKSQRYYVGPVISQLDKLNYERWFQGGDKFQKGGGRDMDENPNHGDAIGAFPEKDDISILGRRNADIQITEDDVRIKAGVKIVDNANKVVFNTTNPAFIKVKYHEEPLNGGNASTVTLVGDKINLLSHKSNNPSIKEGNAEDGTARTPAQKDLISDKKLNEIINEAYKLPYGEKLVELLSKMIDVFCKHTHDYIAMPPNSFWIEEIENAAKDPLGNKELLSDTVRIN